MRMLGSRTEGTQSAYLKNIERARESTGKNPKRWKSDYEGRERQGNDDVVGRDPNRSKNGDSKKDDRKAGWQKSHVRKARGSGGLTRV